MRIAVCFRGQLRTGVEASKNLIHIFGGYFKDIDFFVHTWDNTTCPALEGPWKHSFPKNVLSKKDERVIRALEYLENKKKSMEVVDGLYQSKLDMDYFDKFLKIYNPINYEVESHSEFINKAEGGHPGNVAFPQWYSLYKSVKMKREYEEQNNFIYDIVINMRPDLLFYPNNPFKKQIEWYLNQPDNTFVIENLDIDYTGWRKLNDTWCDDVYHCSSSDLMDRVSLFGDLEYNLERSNQYFLNHLDKIGAIITCNRPLGGGYTIYRDWTLEYDPINEYRLINRLDNLICDYENM